jgi:uncharacterized LabA/DUF88 family protein
LPFLLPFLWRLVKRAYGDWSQAHLKQDQIRLGGLGVQAVHLISHVVGKNTAGMALCVDAMDMLHWKLVDGFCLVSSDCNLTPLAMRIRKEGLTVYGFGARHTPEVFVQACSRFIYVHDALLA